MIELPTSAQPLASIVIVTAGNPERLLRCLEQVAAAAPADTGVEVVVVLNAAAPDLREALEGGVTGATLVTSEIPLGFAGGTNLGVRHARGELLHILHDDTLVDPGWLDALIAALDEHPETGCVGSRLVRPGGELQTAGHMLWRDGRTERLPDGCLPDPAGGPYLVDYCSSAALLVRRDVWDAFGGADEQFHPAQYVDVDIAMGTRSAGYVVMCAPGSHVIHASGGSTRMAFRRFLADRNRRLFTTKWARDLAHQEPHADDPQAYERARAATLRRADAVAAGPRPPRQAPGATGPPLRGPESDADRLRREHEQLRRDLALKDAYMEQLERDGDEIAGKLVSSGEELARVAAQAAETNAALYEALDAERVHAAQLRLRLEHAEDELALRAAALDAIHSGGWWRLRERLLPVVRVAGRISRRARSSRTG